MLVATGGLIGYFSGHAHTFGVDLMAVFDVLGTLFVSALRMLVVLLVISSVISGVASLGSARDLGRRYKHFVYAPGLVAAYGDNVARYARGHRRRSLGRGKPIRSDHCHSAGHVLRAPGCGEGATEEL